MQRRRPAPTGVEEEPCTRIPIRPGLPEPGTHAPLRALLVYESMFGNTEEVARDVAAGLVDAGVLVRLVDVTSARPADEYDFDLLVVGAPTHAFSLSRPSTREDAVHKGARSTAAATGLREWLGAMSGHGRQHGMAAAFDTRVTSMRRLPKAASTRAYHLLDHLGFDDAVPADRVPGHRHQGRPGHR